jgi:uncharacterized protein DUF1707
MPWETFSTDPRRPESALLRASDLDRDVVLGVLADAYADGRITSDEHAERATTATAAKTLGDLPPLIADLVPVHAPPPGGALDVLGSDRLEARAVEHWRRQRTDTLSGWLLISMVCWTVWYLASYRHNAAAGFPWPVFPTVFIGLRAIQVVTRREEIVAHERRRLERRAVKALSPRDEG